MADIFASRGFDVVTDGTDNHLFLINLSKTHPDVSGREVQDALDRIGITLNKNCVPGEKRSPREASGIRIGTAAMTTKGYTAEEFVNVAHIICDVINELQANKTK
jgi:glycine hydroxymethyltransferase